MARMIARTHEELSDILAHATEGSPIIRTLGVSTTERMEMLGDLCNAMDIAEDKDKWINPVMVEARRLWPNEKTVPTAGALGASENTQDQPPQRLAPVPGSPPIDP